MADLEEIYNKHVGDGEGLTAEQTRVALCEAGHNPTDEVQKYYEEHGKDEGADVLSLEEFTELVNSMGDPDESLKAAFKFFAGDDDFIDKDELMKIVATHKELAGEEYADEDLAAEVQELLDKHDKDGNGKLDIDELTAAINCRDIQL